LIQFLLCLAGTAICAATASSLGAATVVPTITAITAITAITTTPTTSTTTTGRTLARSRGVAVDSIGSRFGGVTATATAAGAVCAFFTSGAEAARVAFRALYAVKESVAIIGVAFPAAGHEGKADGLTLGVGAVEFAEGLVSVAQALVCDVGDTLGASGAVIDEGKGGNGTDAAKEVLQRRSVSWNCIYRVG
jgi:hypothetical protein